ncbi:MAG: DUF5689 domain-containing protein [Rikenellaceae bacterium]
MKKLIHITLFALIAVAVQSCYNNYGIPEETPAYTDADFADCEIISIKEFKEHYSYLVGASTDSSTEYNDSEIITENWVVRGKVISSDESGNVYKSLYIQDGDIDEGTRAAIELRLFASNYVNYPEGSTVYVKLKGLSIGDYRGMISVGAHSYSATDTDYIHTTIEGKIMLSEHIFLGESGEITEDDIYVVDASNYSSLYTDASENYLACLVRFEGLESAFTEYGAALWTSYTYPSYFSENSTDGMFDWSPELGEEDDFWVNPPLAYKGKNPATGSSSSYYYYGSSWFTYNRNSSSHTAQFIVRLSGYARFKDRQIPSDGSKINLTAILTQYLSSTGYYTTYQLVMSHEEDLEEL